MNKKQRVFFITSIIIILIFLLILIYILYFKKNRVFDKASTSTTTVNTTTNDFNPITYTYLIDSYLKSFDNCNTGYIFDFSIKDKLEYNDLDDNFIYNTIYNYLRDNKKIEKINSNKSINSMIVSDNNYVEEKIILNDFLNAYENLYGISYQDIKYNNHFSIGDYNFDLIDYNIFYSKKTKPLNCLVNNIIGYLLQDKYISDEKIELVYIVFYSIFEYNDNQLISYATNKIDGEKICSADKISSSEYIDNFNKYKFTFIRKDLSYIFDNVSLVK